MKDLVYRVNILVERDDVKDITPEVQEVENLIADLAENKPRLYFEDLLRGNLAKFSFIGGRGFVLKIEEEDECTVVTIKICPKRPLRISTSLVIV